MGIFLQTILYAHKSSIDVPCKGIGAWLKTQIVRLASTLIPTKVCTIQPRYDILYIYKSCPVDRQ